MNSHECAAVRKCIKCCVEKSASEFEGARSKCKRCRLDERNARYRSDENERIRRLSSRSKYVANNKGKCRDSDKRSYLKRRSAILAQKKDYHRENYDTKIKPYKAVYRAIPEVVERKRAYMAAYFKSHYAKNKAYYLAKFIKRRAQIMRALPAWADLEKIQTMYDRAREMTLLTGVAYEVDHIVPLQGENVCGLHTHENLQILQRSVNRSKSNKLLIEEIV